MKNLARFSFVSSVLTVFMATTMPLILRAQPKAMNTDALTSEAEIIVVGKVGGVVSAWNHDRTRIESKVSVSVEQTIKGSVTGNSVTVVTPGGEIDGVGEWYSHTARFGQDENIVLFAKKDNGGRYRVAGGEHGKISVAKDSRTGNKIIQHFGTLEEFTTQIKKTVKAQESGTKHKE